MRHSVHHLGHIKVWIEHDASFELRDNLTDSSVLNTGETGDMYIKDSIQILKEWTSWWVSNNYMTKDN